MHNHRIVFHGMLGVRGSSFICSLQYDQLLYSEFDAAFGSEILYLLR